MVDQVATAGWDSISAALDRLYPGVEPLHYGTLIKWMLGGPDPLDGVSVYSRADHWHFVSYGMSELYSKESDDVDESGWGFEFTFRVARPAEETEPPMWAANFLQNLARYVFTSGNAFGPGHHLDLNGPIAQSAPDTLIRAAAFTDDPELGVIDTPHGRLRFLQIVGLTLNEYAVIERWDTEHLLEVLAPSLPLFVTDLERADLTERSGIVAAIEAGIRRDGSSTGSLYVQDARWRTDSGPRPGAGPTTTVVFGANAAPRIGRVLQARMPFGRGLLIDSDSGAVGFKPGGQFTVADLGDGFLEVEVPPAVLAELTAVLQPVAGTYRLSSAPDLAVEIVKSQIRDQTGAVVAEIG